MTYLFRNYRRSTASIKMMRTFIVLVTMLVIGVSTPEVFGKGTPWNVYFTSPADADGGTLIMEITLDGGTVLTVTANIAGHTSAADKAAAMIAALNNFTSGGVQVMTASALSTPGGLKVEVHNSWPHDNEIQSFTVTDSQTGQHPIGFKDDPADIIVDITVNISGDGVDREDGTMATAVLGIGEDGPLASVETFGKTGDIIELELAEAFNELYSPDYAAEIIDDALVVTNVPCERGTISGTDDNGLTFEITMTRRPVRHPPTVSEWGLIIMALLLVTVGAIVIHKRRQATV